jgi:hypothetical protein
MQPCSSLSVAQGACGHRGKTARGRARLAGGVGAGELGAGVAAGGGHARVHQVARREGGAVAARGALKPQRRQRAGERRAQLHGVAVRVALGHRAHHRVAGRRDVPAAAGRPPRGLGPRRPRASERPCASACSMPGRLAPSTTTQLSRWLLYNTHTAMVSPGAGCQHTPRIQTLTDRCRTRHEARLPASGQMAWQRRPGGAASAAHTAFAGPGPRACRPWCVAGRPGAWCAGAPPPHAALRQRVAARPPAAPARCRLGQPPAQDTSRTARANSASHSITAVQSQRRRMYVAGGRRASTLFSAGLARP